MMYGLDESIWQSMRCVFADTPALEKVYLFGSRARGDNAASSDIDFAIVAPSMKKSEFTHLWQRLDDLSHIFKMDIVWLDHLEDAELKQCILRDGKAIYP